MSDARLYEQLRKQAARKAARFHMPGHKGRPVLPELNFPFPIDYTEIEGTGNLYEGDEPILSAERDAARYYGARDCLFLTGGSTQALMTALPEGLKLKTIQWGKAGWDKTAGMFRLEANAKYAAYFVAEAAEDETVFTDFVLKGTVKERE